MDIVQSDKAPELEPGAIHNPVSIDDKNGRLRARKLIEDYEQSIKNTFPDTDQQVKDLNDGGLVEYFVDGAYIRQLTIPEDMTIVSQLWKQDRLWVITEGDVLVTTELGTQRIVAPYIGMAPFGTKVALYAYKKTVWLAITGAKAENSDDIETEVIAKDFKELSYPWDKLEHKESLK